VFILAFAALLAVMRTLRGPVFFPLRFLAAMYTDIFRGLPFLIVLLLVGYGIPSLRLQGAPQSPFVLCIIALVLTYSAYVAEVFRAGIESVHPSQSASARALGLTYAQTMRHVVFPQAVRRVLPPLLNDFVSLQKDTSLVSILGVIEVVLTAENQQSQDFKFVHLVFAGLIFVALTVPLTRLTDWFARRQGWVNAGAII
jgi:polar amino acid transport system permease protein